MQRSDCVREPSFDVLVTTFCTCGHIMKLTDYGVTYCENELCPRRASAYRILVKLEVIKEAA